MQISLWKGLFGSRGVLGRHPPRGLCLSSVAQAESSQSCVLPIDETCAAKSSLEPMFVESRLARGFSSHDFEQNCSVQGPSPIVLDNDRDSHHALGGPLFVRTEN